MVYLIAAQARNRVIGNRGAIPWQLPADVNYFRGKISGQVVLMGRRVFDSFPEVLQLVKKAYVLTSSPDGLPDQVTAVTSVESAVEQTNGQDLFVIGGGQTYQAALALADGVYLTEIDHDYDGDVLFPSLPASEWQLVDSQPGEQSGFEYKFSFNYYQRRRG